MRSHQLIFAKVLLMAACAGTDGKDGKATESGATESGTEPSSGAETDASSSGKTSPWGEDYALMLGRSLRLGRRSDVILVM